MPSCTEINGTLGIQFPSLTPVRGIQDPALVRITAALSIDESNLYYFKKDASSNLILYQGPINDHKMPDGQGTFFMSDKSILRGTFENGIFFTGTHKSSEYNGHVSVYRIQDELCAFQPHGYGTIKTQHNVRSGQFEKGRFISGEIIKNFKRLYITRKNCQGYFSKEDIACSPKGVVKTDKEEDIFEGHILKIINHPKRSPYFIFGNGSSPNSTLLKKYARPYLPLIMPSNAKVSVGFGSGNQVSMYTQNPQYLQSKSNSNTYNIATPDNIIVNLLAIVGLVYLLKTLQQFFTATFFPKTHAQKIDDVLKQLKSLQLPARLSSQASLTIKLKLISQLYKTIFENKELKANEIKKYRTDYIKTSIDLIDEFKEAKDLAKSFILEGQITILIYLCKVVIREDISAKEDIQIKDENKIFNLAKDLANEQIKLPTVDENKKVFLQLFKNYDQTDFSGAYLKTKLGMHFHSSQFKLD